MLDQRAESVSPRLPLVDIPMSPEDVLATARRENYRFGQYPIAGAVMDFGHVIDNAELAYALDSHGAKSPDPSLFDETGFKSRSIYPKDMTLAEMAEVEENVGAEVVTSGCKNRGVDPKDLRLLYICNTLPGSLDQPCNDFGERVREKSGATNAEVVNISLACNGLVHSMSEFAQIQDFYKDAVVGFVSVEGLTKSIGGWRESREAIASDPKRLDPTNVSIFSNSANSIIIQAGRDVHIDSVGDFIVIPDHVGVLRAPCGYSYNTDNIDETGIVRTGNSVRQPLPLPAREGDLLAYMDTRLTASWGKNNIPRIFADFVKTYIEMFGGLPDVVLSHYPSKGMFEGILRRIHKFGVNPEDLAIPTVVNDGNSSSAVFGKVLLRSQIEGFVRRAINALAIGYGLGSNCDAVALTIP